MLLRCCSAVVLSSFLLVPVTAQTVRFDTNVGTFDLELNPTGNPNLQGHVDNLLAYVDSGRYDLTVINRAQEDFVMQMGGFQLDTLVLPDNFSDFPAVESFGNVIVDADEDGTADFDLTGLDNTRGTVSLALSGPLNSGSSSFFVNVGDNTGSLNPQGFIPFATVNDMATIDLIMGLQQGVLSDGGLAGSDIPLLDSNQLVFVERAFVVETAAEEAMAMMADDMDDISEAMAAIGSEVSSSSTASLQALTVPEPPALMLAVGALMLILLMKPSTIR